MGDHQDRKSWHETAFVAFHKPILVLLYENLFIRTNQCTPQAQEAGAQHQGWFSSQAAAEDSQAAASGPHSILGTGAFPTVHGSNLPRRVSFFYCHQDCC